MALKRRKTKTMKKVNGVVMKLKIENFCSNDITAIQRLPAKPGKMSVIVRFAKQEFHDAWLAKRQA